MVNGVKSAAISSTYANNVVKNGSKDTAKGSAEAKRATPESKIETLKKRIKGGEYKIDLDRVAKKMVEELLS